MRIHLHSLFILIPIHILVKSIVKVDKNFMKCYHNSTDKMILYNSVEEDSKHFPSRQREPAPPAENAGQCEKMPNTASELCGGKSGCPENPQRLSPR